MNKDEALEKMKQGFKVKQEYFTPGEYLHIVDGVITSEDGYNFETWFHVITPATTWKLNGWSIYNE